MRPIVIPVFAGTAVALACHALGWLAPLMEPGARADFIGTITTSAVTMLGFMLAALAVIASINHTRLVGMMQKTGHYSNLLETIFSASLVFLAIALCGFAMLFGVPAHSAFVSIIAGLHVAALMLLVSVGWKFYLVLSNLNPK